ncbi:MAG: right-handed parallel beta-helix repeat-containing protein [Bacteroidota bacterium]
MKYIIFKLFCSIVFLLGMGYPPMLHASIDHCMASEAAARIPLDAVCPTCLNDGFVIRTPGSYYLTRNLISTTSGVRTIRIFSDNVSLDLNGFTISDTSGGTSSTDTGIEILSYDNVLIHNGHIKGFGGFGIRSSSADHCVLRNLIISDNGQEGVWLDDLCIIENVVFSNNGENGIRIGDQTFIKNCTAEGNGEDGFSVGSGCEIFNCVAAGNARNGIDGANDNLVENCTATANLWVGIVLADGSVARNCMSTDNKEIGIRVTNGTVTNCHAGDNGFCVRDGSCTPSFGSFSTVIVCPEGTGICGVGQSLIYDNHSNNNMIGIFLTSQDGAVFQNYCENNQHQGVVGMPRARDGSISGAMHFRNVCHNNGYTPRSNLTSLGIPSGEYYFTGTDISYGPLVNINGVGDLIGTPNADHPLANFEF